MTLFEALSSNSLFQDLSGKETNVIAESFPLRIKEFKSGQIIRMQGDDCRHLLLLVKGNLTAGMQKPDGKSIIVEKLTAPQAVASAIVFSAHGILPVTLTAETDVLILPIERDILLQIFQKYRQVLVQYLTDMGNKVTFLAEKIRYLQMNSLRQKIAYYIRDLQIRQKSQSVVFDQSLETLSEMFGVARPSLSRELGLLIEKGVLLRDGKKFKVTDNLRFLSLVNDD